MLVLHTRSLILIYETAEALVKSGGDADRSLPKMVATKDFSGDQDEKEVINVRLEADTDLKPDPQTDTHPLESKRELLQLDMSVGKLTWTMSYIKTDKKLPLRRPVSAVIAELVLKQSMIFLDVQPDGTIAGDVQVMDLTLKEDSNILGYIIQQDLYYRKTKPPKAGGGTMDTRRASSKDSMLRVSFSYSKQDIKGIYFITGGEGGEGERKGRGEGGGGEGRGRGRLQTWSNCLKKFSL